MLTDQPSRTAFRVAVRRAAHQIWDYPRVFDDPVALRIIGPDEAAAMPPGKPEETTFDHHLRAFVAVRSRYAEERLAEAVSRGVRQYVVLGAGLDTFAYRNPFRDLKVFEVDHPATQAWKRRLLGAVAIPVPASLTFVPVDFGRETLPDALGHTVFSANQPAFFSWLGVTPYLPADTVLATLRWLISICSVNGVVFDYAVPRSSLGPAARLAFDVLANRVARAGEPFLAFFDPDELAHELKRMGFGHMEDLGSKEINARYFNDRSDDLRVGGGGRLMCAKGRESGDRA